MCGITGFSGQFDSKMLLESNTTISHRGPDSEGHWLDERYGVGMAHRRLSIQDLTSVASQPMHSDDGKVVLIYNGEIYNFKEIRKELEEEGYIFSSNSDTEVLLKLYLSQRNNQNVAGMLKKLNGIFAFALWDVDLKRMLVVRDALGVKPLYYSCSSLGFSFASEIKALKVFQSKDSSESFQDLDVEAINRYLTYLWSPGDGTPTNAVKKLNPGEALWVQEGKIMERICWYKLPAFSMGNRERNVDKVLPIPMNKVDAIKDTETHLRSAVHRQMVSDVPVGAFLSGGLDSSSIVAFARELNPDIRCFTIDSSGPIEEGIVDDLPYAKKVAKHLNVPLDVVHIDPNRMAEDLPAMIAQLDEPLADPAPLNVLYISQLAREQGIKVLLSGAGGDDLFTGYRRHRALMAERYWSWLPSSARRGLEQLTTGLDQRKPLCRRVRKLFSGASLDSNERLVNYFRWIGREDLNKLYSPEFRSLLGLVRAESPMLDFLKELPDDTHPLERMLALEQRFFLTEHNLTYTDKMSMAAGVEVRVPFLDLDLVDFASKIPAQFKQRGKEGKWVLKKAMEPYLPSEVIYRPKSGFGAPLRRWMKVDLRDLVSDVLGKESLSKRGLFDVQAVQKLIHSNDTGKIDASYTLFSLVCIELWCRSFIDASQQV